VGQANIAYNQQVNNQNPENELLEHIHGEQLEFGTMQTPIRNNSEVEAVGAINCPADGGRETEKFDER